MYNFLCKNVLIFLIYIFTKRIETFLSRDINSIPDIKTF